MFMLPQATAPAHPRRTASPAQALRPPQRQRLAVQTLAGQPITALADQHRVSRQFVYRQAGKARRALDGAFAPPPPADPPKLGAWPLMGFPSFPMMVARPWR